MFVIEKAIYLKGYIVWEVHRNYKIDRFRGTKRECQKWITNTK